MLKAFFDIFQVTDAQITPSAMARLKWASALSVPAIPFAGVAKYGNLPGGLEGLFVGLAFISTLGLLYAFTSRLANRLWIPDKYLDEAEIARKRQSGSLTFLWTIAILMAVTFGMLLWINVQGSLPAYMKSDLFIIIAFGAVITMPISFQTLCVANSLGDLEPDQTTVKTSVDRYYKYGAIAVLCLAGTIGYLINL